MENARTWHDSDLPMLCWFRTQRTPETTAERYIYVEYDMLFRIPVTEFYADVWQADIAGAQLFRHGPHPTWHWFREVNRLPPQLRKHAAGLMPLCGIMMSHRVLETITSNSIPMGVFCELRLATLATYHGFDIVELPWHRKRNLSWKPEFLQMQYDSGAFHPVKELQDDELQ
jgi:hypothetical protein